MKAGLEDRPHPAPAPGTGRPRATTTPSTVRSPANRVVRVLAACLSVAMLAGIGFVVLDQQRKAREDVVGRFDLRAEIAARFLESFVDDLTSHEADVATAELGSRSVSQEAFSRVTTIQGFQAAVLLDESGRLLRVFPRNPELIGTDLGSQYAHLGEAVAGRVAVSDVVPSAARSVPVVGLAVPFATSEGSRTYSGALAIAGTSLGSSYLRNLSPIKGASVWLIDGTAQTIASSSSASQSPDLLMREDPALFAALQDQSRGSYEGPVGNSRFAVADVGGTSWRLVVSAPESQIFIGIGGIHGLLPWLMFAGLALAVAGVVLSQIKLAKTRARQLDSVSLLALTDPMTGLYNRRGYELLIAQLLRDATREKRQAFLMIFDMDGLKGINDRLGHAVGDEAITAAATLLRTTFRDNDVIARLGGDEFAVMGMHPDPGSDGSAQLGRLNDALDFYNAREGASFRLDLSVGLAIWDPSHPTSLDDLEDEADRRMYADKVSGTSALTLP